MVPSSHCIMLWKADSLYGKHVMVSGGSSGIGLSVAEQAATQGANVTLLARDMQKLQDAKERVQKAQSRKADQMVLVFSVDVCDSERVAAVVLQAEAELGPVFFLANCAGFSIPARFEDLSPKDLRRLVDVNYLGSAYLTQAALPSMKASNRGHVVFCSSQAGLFGLYGFTGYSASKFALRGFAEALHMELKPFNISVTLSLPPDTDTPGFSEEEKHKPEETRLICQSAGLMQPDVVAKAILTDGMAGRFFSTVGFEGHMLTTVCAGMSPVSSLCELFTHALFMGPARLVSSFYLYSFNKIVQRCKYKRNQSKKEQ